MNAQQEHVANFFIGGRPYIAEKIERDYLAELASYSDERWEAPRRPARLAAVVNGIKRLKC